MSGMKSVIAQLVCHKIALSHCQREVEDNIRLTRYGYNDANCDKSMAFHFAHLDVKCIDSCKCQRDRLAAYRRAENLIHGPLDNGAPWGGFQVNGPTRTLRWIDLATSLTAPSPLSRGFRGLTFHSCVVPLNLSLH